MKPTLKRLTTMMLAVAMVVSLLCPSVWAATVDVEDKTANFDKSYTLYGRQPDDLVAIALKQEGKTEAELGYKEFWCASFVSNCAKLAGLSNIIPPTWNAGNLHQYVIDKGGRAVSSRQKGDLIFYRCKSCGRYVHVGIILDSTYSIEGNYSNKVKRVTSYSDQYGHSTSKGTVVREYVHPNYNLTAAPGGRTVSDGVYHIVSAINNTKNLDVKDRSTSPGANVQLWGSRTDSGQMFRVSYLGNGYYSISNIRSSQYLDVANGDTNCGVNVQQWYGNGNNAQRWVIKSAGNGYYYIISKCNSLYLDVSGGGGNDGDNIWLYEGNGTKSQKWKFVKMPNPISCDSTVTGNATSSKRTFNLNASAQGNTFLQYSVVSKYGNMPISVDSKGKVTIPAYATGIATIKVYASGNNMYEASSKTVTLKIYPAKSAAPSLKNQSGRRITASWKSLKANKYISGYRIDVSKNSSFPASSTSSYYYLASKKSVTFQNATIGKTYYIRVCPYIKANGTRYVAIGTSKSITVKK